MLVSVNHLVVEMCLIFLRFQEKGNLEVLLFTIQSRMRANNQRVYMPKEGALVSDINRVRSCPGKIQRSAPHRSLNKIFSVFGSWKKNTGANKRTVLLFVYSVFKKQNSFFNIKKNILNNAFMLYQYCIVHQT